MTVATTDDYIEQHVGSALQQLARLVRQPSVSSQNEGIEAAARLVAGMLEESGFDAQIFPTEGYPVVYAEAGDGDKTLLCYNHYDVQPAEPFELWNSPPFEMVERNGKLYGRGVSDDKGEIASRLAALEAVRAVHGALPCKVKFVIEGGEEISSPHIPEFVSEHRELLGADACIWESGGVDYEGRPGLTLGMRGILYVQYTAHTMSRDAHSGSAHLLPNAAWRLVRMLNRLKDEDDRILIPGFYDHARPPTADQERLLEQLDLDEREMRRSYGIEHFNRNLTGMAAKEAVFSPTANIAGLSAGYEGEGPKTVIPAGALAKMDFRLVPDQDPEDILQKLRAYLDDLGFGDIEVASLGGERPAVTPPSDPVVQIAAETARAVYGKEPRIAPLVGGSGPMYPFRAYLDVPIVNCGVGYPESFVHAPNENIRRSDFILGTRHMARFVQRWAGV
ncbi:MAG TPA: M20/M25/M40 family metallo-hydrolase [Chloroflexota bacterium]|nr:M20/M25/M40 family metallo-hydrolase [Chloroflexota bacterium]